MCLWRGQIDAEQHQVNVKKRKNAAKHERLPPPTVLKKSPVFRHSLLNH